MKIQRRHLLLGMTAGPAALVAGCGDSQGSTDSTGGFGVEQGTKPGPARDATLLNTALELEMTAVAAYRGGARLLRGSAAELARTFLAHEEEHLRFVERAIRRAGARPIRLTEPPDFPELRTGDDFLEFAVEGENEAVFAYTEIVPQLSDPRLRADIASILTNEAQHAAALRQELGQQPVPQAVVTGVTEG
jgi:rubrerythrin